MGSPFPSDPVAVHHVEEGDPDAPVLVLSHPLGTDLHVWRPQMDRLARSFRVVAYDQRGHGLSPVPAGPYAIADLGRDVIALLDRIGVARASFAGSSLGGMVGLWLAANAPDRVDRLAVCSSSAWLGNEDAWTDRAAIVRSNGTVAIAEWTVHRWFSAGFGPRNPALIERLVARFVGTADEGYAACCEAIGTLDLRDDITRITAPTLVIAGRGDLAIPVTHSEHLAERIAASEYVLIDDAGHLASLEQPDEISELLERHFHSPVLELV